jgi:hypothetical protein
MVVTTAGHSTNRTGNTLDSGGFFHQAAWFAMAKRAAGGLKSGGRHQRMNG